MIVMMIEDKNQDGRFKSVKKRHRKWTEAGPRHGGDSTGLRLEFR